MNETASKLRALFLKRFGSEPQIARAPGRVNLIGDHTDYNGGLVLPMALDFSTWVACAARSDGRMVVHSEYFDETVDCELAEIAPRAADTQPAHWADYPLGVAACLQAAGVALQGANLLIQSDVPLGAGLSSSASLEVATAGALQASVGATLAPLELALLCQRAENDYVGMRCGIMDQYIAVFARAGYALELDCRRLVHRAIPVPLDGDGQGTQAHLILCDSMRRHELAGSEYNERRADCESALRDLQARSPQLETLGDLSAAVFAQYAAELDPVHRRRVRHVVTENERVRAASAALSANDMPALGRLMDDSHTSLRDDYQVSCAELDCLVSAAREFPATLGARMTGGGFGGCTVNLVQGDTLADFEAHVTSRYRASFGQPPRFYRGVSASGLSLVGSGDGG